MIDPKIIDDLSKRLADMAPSGVRQLQADLEKNFHALLQAAFAKMDLVTRQGFDVQQGVLARTRAKLETLEKPGRTGTLWHTSRKRVRSSIVAMLY